MNTLLYKIQYRYTIQSNTLMVGKVHRKELKWDFLLCSIHMAEFLAAQKSPLIAQIHPQKCITARIGGDCSMTSRPGRPTE